ncbi:hypothetical protein SACC_31400 [Saccharolobus caldissimus]|uniref:Uncharacterized protein n=1 Tax=Saccharolobus caldissimus TaxID=1702097 RepID=A0AAQ4CWE2_9CREN|nr:hypothetical protein SACC_31400 [Saccharolobus caldissimus]
METRWKVPVLTQIILILMEYINFKPRFYARSEVALALAMYLAGLSSWRAILPHSTECRQQFRSFEIWLKFP